MEGGRSSLCRFPERRVATARVTPLALAQIALECERQVSSDVRDLTPGARWLNTIEAALNDAQAMVVICSRASLSRPWINFETGCAWNRRIGIVPVCHSGQRRDQLPYPFSTLQALQLEDDDFAEHLTKALCTHLEVGWTPSVDLTSFLAD